MNQKGFTLVEILAAVAILAILSGIAVGAVSRYLQKARTTAYERIMESSKEGISNKIVQENHFCSNDDVASNDCKFKIEDMENEDYIESLEDPAKKGTSCSGEIRAWVKDPTQDIVEYSYKLELKCANYEKTVCWGLADTSGCDIIK